MYVPAQNVATKWADCLVIAVRHQHGYGRGSGNIASVLVVEDYGDRLGAPQWMTVGDVVLQMAFLRTFATAIERNGKLYYGAPVECDHRRGVTYLRTVADGVLVDNLDELPER